MKMIFFSAERAEAELVRTELLAAGVACEVREKETGDGRLSNVSDAEVWIQNDEDSHRALMLCVELGVGFAKRAVTVAVGEDEAETQQL
jgi:hypothetical protein